MVQHLKLIQTVVLEKPKSLLINTVVVCCINT